MKFRRNGLAPAQQSPLAPDGAIEVPEQGSN